MATLVLRTVKGSPLTNAEVDGNFSNINSEVSSVEANVGVLTNLSTTAKGNIVSAINELAAESSSNAAITGGTVSNVITSNIVITSGTISNVVLANVSGIYAANITGLNTGSVPESGNLYYTDSRARASISVSGAGSYDNTTGIITVTGGVTSVAGATGAISNVQIVAGFTAGVVPGTSGNVLTSNGTYWISSASAGGGGSGTGNLTIVSSSADATVYPIFTANTSGVIQSANVASTKLYFNANSGTLSATTFNSLSDETQKYNVSFIADASDTVNSLQGVEFDWVENGKKSAGVIAQELEKILPHLVDTSPEGLKTVNYSGIIAYLIEAVKDMDNRIKVLEAK